MAQWEELRESCLNCTACGLAQTRTNVVFGTGVPTAKIMLIGEGPGEQEDLTGEPFVGRGGKLLDEMLTVIDLSRRENVYIANIVKCRPPKNRDPLPEEQEACIGWLRTQVKYVAPKIIVCLGRGAAAKLIKPDFKITKEHGQWFEKGAFLMTAIYHPAFLLRDTRRLPEAYDDLKVIQQKIREVCPEVYAGLE